MWHPRRTVRPYIWLQSTLELPAVALTASGAQQSTMTSSHHFERLPPATTGGASLAMWSPDYGDYWAAITPRGPVQDFCFESATIMYFLTPDGSVQKMPYTGTAWANTLDSVTTVLPGTHTIAAYPEGKVQVGTDAFWANLYATTYCGNFNTDTPPFGPL